MEQKTAIIAGAGPAGLTAAYELLTRTDIKPIIYEKGHDIGGISKTVNYKGNRIDIGGHRFFSKSDRVMDWWLNILPLEGSDNPLKIHLRYQGKDHVIKNEVISKARLGSAEKVLLLRNRVSRIYFIRKFFQYPLVLTLETLKQLGLKRTLKILFSYLRIRLKPLKNENTLEDFIINRFGRELYFTFFKAYTEKVWGKKCAEIPATWGKQRIKSLSISGAIKHAVKNRKILKKKDASGIAQKDTETSLIEKFLYPKYGPGQLWEEVAAKVVKMGGEIIFGSEVIGLHNEGEKITNVSAIDGKGQTLNQRCDYFFSTMPINQLICGMTPLPSTEIYEIAKNLQYRDFITVGLLLKNFGDSSTKDIRKDRVLKDNWIYIQDDNVQVGRIQIFNNWSPAMVNDSSHFWIGMEFFCNTTDQLWELTDEELTALSVKELVVLGLAQENDFLDSTVIRTEKAYPAYFGSYNEFDKIIEFSSKIENLYLIGRNGMHRYNNADHSMLTAMIAVDNIISGISSKENLWNVNTEEVYHEKK